MPKLKELSDKQNEFIHGVVNLGLKQTESARRAGYNQPAQSAYNMMNSPAILRKIQHERLKLFQSDLSIVAVSTLKEIMKDSSASSSSRVSACRCVLEISGDFIAGSKDQTKELSELSSSELGQIIDKLDLERIRLAKDVTPRTNKMPINKDETVTA